MPHTVVGERGQADRHIQRARRVLAQNDALVRLAVGLRQRLRPVRVVLAHAQRPRHVLRVHRAVLQILLQANEARVETHLGGLLDGARATRHAVRVRHRRVTGLHRIRRVHPVERDALLERRRQAEDLERGTRLHRRVRVIPAVGILAAVVRLDLTVARIDGHHRGAHLVHLRGEILLDDLLRLLLRLRINGGSDLEAQRFHVLLRDPHRGKLLHHAVLQQPVGARGLRKRPVIRRIDGLRVTRRIALRLRDRAGLHHAVKHVVPALLRLLAVHPRIELARALNRRRDDRRLLRGELRQILAKVRVGRRRHAIGITPKINRIEVRLEDLILGPLVGHLRAGHELPQLPRDGALVAHQRILHILLRNSGTAARRLIAGEHAPRRTRIATKRKTRVGVELAILRGQHRLPQMLRHLIQAHLPAVTLRRHETGQLRLTVRRIDRGDLRVGQLARLRDIRPDIRDAEQHERHRHNNNEQRDEDLAPHGQGTAPATVAVCGHAGSRPGALRTGLAAACAAGLASCCGLAGFGVPAGTRLVFPMRPRIIVRH